MYIPILQCECTKYINRTDQYCVQIHMYSQVSFTNYYSIISYITVETLASSTLPYYSRHISLLLSAL